MSEYELIGSKGCGNVIVEAALALSGLPYATTDIPYLEAGSGRARLLSLNPLGQVPTLVLPDGMVMTESAAILLHIAEVAPAAGLVPGTDRPRFLNALILFVAAIYPTFTYGDTPEDWTGPGDAAAVLRDRTDARRRELLLRMEAMLDWTPYALGAAPCALDLYAFVMTHWRPRRAWFAEHTPRLLAAADAVARLPAVAPVAARHFA